MTSIPAEYYDGRSSRAVKATIEIVAKGLTVYPENGIAYSVQIHRVKVQPKIGSLPRILDLPDHSCIQVTDHAALEAQLPHRRDLLHYLENNKKFVVGSFLSLGAFCALTYFILIPALALLLAPKMTHAFGESLTRETLAYLEVTTLIEKEKRDKYLDRLESIREFDALKPYGHYEIMVYDTPAMGANAFALPSNTIVVTRQLMDLISDDTEVLAVLLHEVGHVEKFHVMQRIIGDAVIGMAMLAVFGADWTSLPMVVLSTGYSRGSEKEADLFAAEKLIAQDLPPSLLGQALTKLEGEHQRVNGRNYFKYFSSHPDTSERVEYLESYKVIPPLAPQ